MNQDKLDRYMNDDKYTRNAVILLGLICPRCHFADIIRNLSEVGE